MAEAIAQALRGSALVVLDDAAHLSNIEQADRFNAELRRFLHRVDSR
jgi:pimeloyl-ACP methyl ester carboxylesterase